MMLFPTACLSFLKAGLHYIDFHVPYSALNKITFKIHYVYQVENRQSYASHRVNKFQKGIITIQLDFT